MNKLYYWPVALVFLLLMSLLSACALSPQTVTIRPLVDARSQDIGRGRTLALSVTDKRPQQAFGNRGGAYQTALISPHSDIAQAIRAALSERLQASGFKVINSTAAEPLALLVEIQKIDYTTEADPLLGKALFNIVRVHATVASLARNNGRTLSGQYQANSARRQPGYPSEADNAMLINEVVAETLRQLLHDPEVISLLAQ